MMFRFAQPLFLLLLILIPGVLYIGKRRRRQYSLSLPASKLSMLVKLAGNNSFWTWLFPALRSLILALLILALAQPQWGKASRNLRRPGVDIVIALDISGSMLALDFLPQNRLGAAINVARDFITRRPNDRFALIAFSEYALTASPLTFDHDTLIGSLDALEVNMEASGTAIGMGLAKAVARLKDSTAKSRIVILITDGVNNTGEIDPLAAARMAKALGIKVYPIGVGSGGLVPFPYSDPFFGTRNIPTLIELDMATLDQIAELTGTGKAANATNANELRNIMTALDKLEKTEISAKVYLRWSEQFPWLLLLAAILIGLELLLKAYYLPLLME